MRRFFTELLRCGVSLICLNYAFHGVQWADLWGVLRAYPVAPVLAAVLVSFCSCSVLGLRLMYMHTPHLCFRSTFCASLVGLAVNNVLPAKAGEIAKAAWLAQPSPEPLQPRLTLDTALGLVFFERFFDVNMLSLLSLWFIIKMGQDRLAFLLVFCLASGWALILLLRTKPGWQEHAERLPLPTGLRLFLVRFLSAVAVQLSGGRILRTTVSSLALWALYALQMGLTLNGAARLGLSLSDLLAVFALSNLGMLLPSSPGALGVYEAVAVAVLTLWGVPRDQALAAALLDHMVQFIPVTLAGGAVWLAFPIRTKRPDSPATD